MRTHGVFVNDQWRLGDRLSFNLGVRWDKNAAKDGGGVTRANDSTFSPRLGATWYVTGSGNPFTTQPARGVNWDFGPNFGKARNATDYQTPRTFQVSVGARF